MLEHTRRLPTPLRLDDAVDLVIDNNKADGYTPNRFIPMVKGKSGRELVQVCEYLITSGQTLEHIENAFFKYPQLLTIEDLVAAYGALWGFSRTAIESAQARSAYFDQLAKYSRYA